MGELVERLAERLRQGPKCKDVVGNTIRACPPATARAVTATEERLGFALPRTLRRIYLEVANGGFGPGYGVMGVEDGFTDDLGFAVADLYEHYRKGDPEDPTWQWPERLLLFCHWGCAIYSAVDCSQNPSPVCSVDPGSKEPDKTMETIIKLHKPSFEAWLSDWLDGRDLWHEVWP